jgi:hypothetical protein
MIHTTETRKTNSAGWPELSMLNKVTKVKKNVCNLKTHYEVQETKKDIINIGFGNKRYIPYSCKRYAYQHPYVIL